MAKLIFLKEGEKSQKKNYIPSGTYKKRWKIAFYISGVLNVLLTYFIYYNLYK